MAARTPSPQTGGQPAPHSALAQADRRRRVTQVVNNLLDNAVKFSPPGATVTVDVEEHTHTVIIRVRDEGPGIAPEHLQRIFNRFIAWNNRACGRSGGGLGLAICKGLVEAIGGQIAVTSQVGQGSVFSLQLVAHAGCEWQRLIRLGIRRTPFCCYIFVILPLFLLYPSLPDSSMLLPTVHTLL